MEGERDGRGGEGERRGREGEGSEGGLCSSNISLKKPRFRLSNYCCKPFKCESRQNVRERAREKKSPETLSETAELSVIVTQ